MSEIRCHFQDRVYRGQDFYHRYCENCPKRDQAIITPATISCPYLKHTASTPPWREVPWIRELIGQVAIIPRGGY
jgi:hypothetical protein